MQPEYLSAIMITSSAFITIAGILVALGQSTKCLGIIGFGFLLVSITFGAIAIFVALVGFTTTQEDRQSMLMFCVLMQFIMWYIPLWISLVRLWSNKTS